MRSLEMKKPALLIESPNRQNISYAVKVVTPDPAKTFQTMVKKLKEQKGMYTRTIIYCQTIKVTTFLYGFFQSELGNDMYIDDSLDPKKRTVEMFHSRIDELNREHILNSMGMPDGSVRVLIATIAYGMGIDCKDVKVVIHYGPSYNLETYPQESGRAGRNNTEQCKSVMLYSSLMMKYCSEDIKVYARDSSTCRRKMLLENFDVEVSSLPGYEHLHQCCDTCQKECKCQGNSCDFLFFDVQSSEVQETTEHRVSRSVSETQKESLQQKLNYLKSALKEQHLRMTRKMNLPMFTPAKFYGGIGDSEIKQILEHCDTIGTVADIFKYIDIWHLSVAVEVLFCLSQVFGDVHVIVSELEDEPEDTLENFEEDIFEFDIADSVLAGIPGELFSIAEDSILQHEEETDSDIE